EFYAWLRRGREPIGSDALQEARQRLMDLTILELADQVRQLPEALKDGNGLEAKILDQVREADFRVEATQIVLSAVLASTGWGGLDRRKFKALI
ncbi:hypothetical protein, partial [Pseudomonas sp. MPR-AND1A]|uniref:hypothetical protein n=1 Tax=Pseudomonas sp. MPR-AND1A TaxID=2070600 RepID=UPI000CAD1DDB